MFAKYALRISLLLTSVAILAGLVVRFVDLSALRHELVTFPIPVLGLILLLSLTMSLLKGYRFHLLLRLAQVQVPLRASLRAFVASQVASPFIGGEMLRGYLIKVESGSRGTNIAGSVIAQAIIEVAAAIGLLLIGSVVYEDDLLGWAVAGAVLMAGLLTFIINQTIQGYILDFISRIRPLKRRREALTAALATARSGFAHDSERYPSWRHLSIFSLGIASHMVAGIILYLILLVYQAPLNIIASVMIASGSVVIQTLTGFVPGGLGFTEGGMAGVLAAFNLPWHQAIAVVMVYRAVTLVFSMLIGLLTLLMFYTKTFITAKHSYAHAPQK